jgi:hypothetical protein
MMMSVLKAETDHGSAGWTNFIELMFVILDFLKV